MDDGGDAPVRASSVDRRSSLLLITLVFAVALGARLLAYDVVITADEDNWMRRAGGFTYGLLNGRLGRTYQNGHPGVTTMWLAMLTLGPERMVQYADPVHNQALVGRVAGFWDALVAARVGFALATALLVALICGLTWRLFGAAPGVLAGLIVGLEPFYLGISQLVHMDALLSGCMLVSVLAALVARDGRATGSAGRLVPRGWTVLSGAFAGLALLSKSPALFLLLFVPAMILVPLFLAMGKGKVAGDSSRSPERAEGSDEGAAPRVPAPPPVLGSGGRRSVLVDVLVWLGAVGVTVVALWPAVWVLGPWEVMGRVAAFTRETGGQPHEAGSFFWGQSRGDPGPLFYPVAALFRLAPLTLLGLAMLVALWRRVPSELHRPALVLVAYCLGFLAMMTLGAKKFDRYVLPLFPALGVLAAVGIWQGLVFVAHRRVGGRGWGTRRARLAVAFGVVLAIAVWPLAGSYPYYLASYNPLLGGGAAAQRTVMVGNGEGLDQVAGWLNGRPNAENLWVASHSFDILQPLIRASGEPLRDRVPSGADYLVLYRYQMQIGQSPRVLDHVRELEPELSVWIAGIEYARVYRGPRLAQAGAGGS